MVKQVWPIIATALFQSPSLSLGESWAYQRPPIQHRSSQDRNPVGRSVFEQQDYAAAESTDHRRRSTAVGRETLRSSD